MISLRARGVILVFALMAVSCANLVTTAQDRAARDLGASVRARFAGATLTRFRFERHPLQWVADQHLLQNGDSLYNTASGDVWLVVAEGDIPPAAWPGAAVVPGRANTTHFSRMLMLFDPENGDLLTSEATPKAN